MIILTHRGLEPTNKEFYGESSYEAFKDHLGRGFGIEFDIFFEDSKILVGHNLKKQKNILSLRDVLELIKNSKEISALHIKGKFQTKENLDNLLKILDNFQEILDRLIIFDLKINSAKYLKEKDPRLILAASVAHKYDIKRYNHYADNTLLSMETALDNKNIYDWAWLDEWDLINKNGKKKLYTEENFNRLRQAEYKIALVTPELHGTSPDLLGKESHEDSFSKERLFSRIKEIISLKPEAICTDYPEEVKELI